MSDLITCYGYVSYPGDSLLNITWRFAKRSGASTNHYLSWLLINNRNNLLHCGINPAHPDRIIPKPHVILALMPPLRQYPPVAHHPLHADMALAMSNDKLDMINGYNFHRLINEYELPLMSATAQLTTALQWVRAKTRQEAIMGGVGMTLMSAADALSDYTKERAEKLVGKMQEVEAKLKAYLQAPDALKAQAKAMLIEAHRELNEQFEREIKALVKYNSAKAQIRFISHLTWIFYHVAQIIASKQLQIKARGKNCKAA